MKILFFTVKRCATKRWPEFNLDSRWRFHYSYSKNDFKIEEGMELPPQFWSVDGEGGASICISAVVGANGAGKTSFARALAKTFVDGRSGRPYVLICEFNGGIHLYSNVLATKRETLDNALRNRFGSLFKAHWDEALGEPIVDGEAVPDRYFVYLSPHMTTDVGFRRAEGRVWDYSTTGLMSAAAGRCVSTCVNPVKLYAAEEKLRLLKAVQAYVMADKHEDDRAQIQTEMVSALTLVIDVARESRAFAVESLAARKDEGAAEVSELLAALMKHPLVRGVRSNFAVKAFVGFAIAYWNDCRGGRNENVYRSGHGERLFELCRSIVADRNIEAETVIRSVAKWAREWLAGDDDDVKASTKKILHGEKIIALGTVLLKLDTLNRFVNGGKLKIPLRQFRYGCFWDLLEVVAGYAKTVVDTEYLVFDLKPRLSSGEMAFMSIWGRLFDFIETWSGCGVRTSVGSCGWGRPSARPFDMVLFLDEAEIALHPEWQRRLVWNMLWFFREFAPDVRAHVIFATHSPILLSDIPKGNVVFLESKKMKAAERMHYLRGLSDLHETFAANIYDLYRLPFFMRQGLTGYFSRAKVRNMMQAAFGDKNQSMWVRLVGDDVIRNYLESRGRLRHERYNDHG